MTNSLVDFWEQAKFEEAPFLHPCDKVEEKYIQKSVSNYSEYVEAFKARSLSDELLHLGLLPQPYMGNLEKARIIILTSNPGLAAVDYHAEHTCSEFRQEIIASIRQEKSEHMFLDPKWAWTGGFCWWERKLRKVAEKIADMYFHDYGSALKDLSKEIATIDLVPYHSLKFRKIDGLESSNQAREFVNSIGRRPGDDRAVIVTRSTRDWGNFEGRKDFVVYKPEHARSASLGPDSDGGKAILAVYKKKFSSVK